VLGLLDLIFARFWRDNGTDLGLDGQGWKSGELAVEEPDVFDVHFALDAVVDELDEGLEKKIKSS
jgi:hypothetical protein